MASYVAAELRRSIRSDAKGRCGYCHTPEILIGMPMEFEHIYPEALGGETVRENLWLACSRCNDFKLDRIEAIDPETQASVRLFHPRDQIWTEHFAWSPDGVYVIGRTAIGRATIDLLKLNNEFICTTRQFWVAAGWWPPRDEL